MAKSRKAARAKKTMRKAKPTTTKRKRKVQAGSKAKSKARIATARKRPGRKPRRKKKDQSIVAKVTDALDVVGDTVKETSDLQRRMGARGGLSEG